MDWLDKFSQFWPHLVAVLDVLVALATSTHVLLHKRDSRAATLWLGIIWFVPVLGTIFYLAFGFNRIRTRAIELGLQKRVHQRVPRNLGEPLQRGAEHLQMLARVVGRVAGQSLIPGNQVQCLVNGDQAFPAMLAAIDSARESVSLATYIFDDDKTGGRFLEALSRAVGRGVAVRVLIDDAGARYSWPRITRQLKGAGIRYALFLPSSLLAPWRVTTINLRNHRKIMVVDGRVGFTGGMNLRHGNVLAEQPRNAIQDLHFQFAGPVVGSLQETFANDWAFTTGEKLGGETWFPELKSAGEVVARVIVDGPDEDYDPLRWTLLAALAEAQTSVQIITPYFVPDTALISALNLAALRGVAVDILLPASNNLPVVHWASRALWWQVLERGCRIWLTPGPFDHSKLMVVDGHWVFLGSANWDTRSLRLNFELNVECYGREFATRMLRIVEQKTKGAQRVTLAEVDARSFPGKLRDATARLFSPFL